ncbi:NB-ARC domain, LRR domain containing protein [Trema orientale]|uniref:NB-ARC domain, LRR domain containing protein n=1 Tax=Trema orientale TaxID=63057 RepID=A0A2P5DBP9_TREOI|nr:NB-ARC domain, LRR domain containing protein [Trema orientale]
MKKPRKEVISWLTNVENAKNQFRQLEEKVSSSGSGLFKRLQLERSVDNFTTEVMELNDQSKFPRGLTLNRNETFTLLTKRLVGETIQRKKNVILDCLIDGEDSVIGVYGMGGVGKTALLKHIYNQLIDHRINVSWVTVSQDFSTCKLQHDIAKTLNLDISEVDDEMHRAARLARSLKRRKDFILILDDVWEHICVKRVGIPVGENGCKLVLTTRSLTVCRMMQCQNQIKVEPLSGEEAWILFMKTLGNETFFSLQIEEIAWSLVEECAGLPLGIIMLAISMRGVDDIHEWQNALEEIKGAEYWNGNMEFYEIYECDGLKRLFTPAQLSHLQSLETLEVCDCDELVEIIGETPDHDQANPQEATTTVISFPPKLRHLDLDGLPELKSFCSCSLKISNSLEEINIEDCWMLLRITLLWEEPYPPPSLKSIKVDESWWDWSLVAWKHPETKAILQPFVKSYKETLFDSDTLFDNNIIPSHLDMSCRSPVAENNWPMCERGSGWMRYQRRSQSLRVSVGLDKDFFYQNR